MSKEQRTRESFEALEKAAHDTSDVRPLSEPLRRQWEAAKQTGAKARRVRSRKDPKAASRIVPISIDAELLAEVDRFMKSACVTRSQLVAEGLRLRMKSAGATKTN